MIDRRYHDAVIFDLDGVVTDTAPIHAAAWKTLFDDFLARRPGRDGEDHSPFTEHDYGRLVDGKPRCDGVADFLTSRGIKLAHGSPTDLTENTVCGLGNRKQEIFVGLLGGGVSAFDSTIALVHQLGESGIATAVYSASLDCERILRAAGVGDLFGVRVDGVVANQLGLPGKPDPAVLVEAANRLGVRPDRCVVVEDAVAGVRAGRDGGFSLVIGVDRTGHADSLLACGADTVVADLAEVTVRSGDAEIRALPDILQVCVPLKMLAAARRPVVFLDFDGTLSDIVDDPRSATLVDGAAAALEGLAAECPIVVVSGRDLEDVRARVGVGGLWFAGSHGFELVGPDGSHHQNAAAAAAAADRLAQAAARLRGSLAAVTGVMVEHKRFAVAVHYRNVETEQIDAAIAAVRRLAHSDGFRVTAGRKVIELRPNIDWDKGTTVGWVLERIAAAHPGSERWLPIYVGDDLTDEDAFDAVRFNGVGIVVRNDEAGDRPSAATFSLDGPPAVCEFLRRLTDDLTAIATEPDGSRFLVFDDYAADHELLREALCTVGNGYVGVRGCAPESSADTVHYPGTYVAGVYNTLTDEVAGHTVENEALVNLPNWLPVTFRVDGGAWFDVDRTELLQYRQTLDLHRATLTRQLRFRDAAGRVTTMAQQRFASMDQPHVVAMQTTICAENWSGTVEFRSILDANVCNSLVDRYRSLSSTHLTASRLAEVPPDSVLVCTRTLQSDVSIALAARSTVLSNGVPIDARYRFVQESGRCGYHIEVVMAAGQTVTLEKVATIFTGRDAAISEPARDAQRCLGALGGYADLHRDHVRAWRRLWEQFDIDVGGDVESLRTIRLHILHLLQTISPHSTDLDAGVPARGLHGEAYRGHIFWDELFIIPVLSLHQPSQTRSLLHYRYRRLPEARRAARRAGYLGAMYPWQSASDGSEASPQLHLNPRSGRWSPDPSARAHHVGLAIAYSVWQHYQATDEQGYLLASGAEMLAEIARFWVSRASLDDSRGRYVIRGVIGPDEFHSGYPGRQYDGIDNNAYTNIMAVWVIMRAIEALDRLLLRDRLNLLEKIGLTTQEHDRWLDVSRRMFVPFHDGVISQFEGYSELAELDWERYRQRYGDIQRLDRILEAENDSVNNYKASKQADALMLFYLLSSEELLDIFGRLGYHFRPEQIPQTVDYYLARTSHGSTLSAVVHSWVLARANRHNALNYFEQVLKSDIADIQGGTTAEGIHLAAMAGSVDLLQRCFTGLEVRNDRLVLGPHWPEPLDPLEFTFTYRRHRLHLRISGRTGVLSAEAGDTELIAVECRGRVYHLGPGQSINVG